MYFKQDIILNNLVLDVPEGFRLKLRVFCKFCALVSFAHIFEREPFFNTPCIMGSVHSRPGIPV